MAEDDYREIDVPAGQLAEVVTYLERREPPDGPPPEGPWRLERRQAPDLDWYLGLYRDVGEEWLWYSRLMMLRTEVARILEQPSVRVYSLVRDDRDVGIGELSFAEPGEVEICFFGVAASEFGAGAGRWLMRALLAEAWRATPERVWLHTCTLDHPHALPFYLRQGFKAYKRTVGIYSDPRLGGDFARETAARVPIIHPEGGGGGGADEGLR